MHTNANDSLHVWICLLRLNILEYTGKIDTMYIIWRDMMQLCLSFSISRCSNIFFWWSMEAFRIQYKSYSCAISEILEKLSPQTYTQCIYTHRKCVWRTWVWYDRLLHLFYVLFEILAQREIFLNTWLYLPNKYIKQQLRVKSLSSIYCKTFLFILCWIWTFTHFLANRICFYFR